MQIIDVVAGGTDPPGERNLIQSLVKELDDAYVLFRRVLLPRATEPIDAVLVGPCGILIMAIFNRKGTYACDGDEWFHSSDDGQSWQTADDNPIKRVLYDHIQLKAYLDREGVRGMPFENAVVCPNARTQLIPQQPATLLLDQKELQRFARKLTGQTYLTQSQVDTVVGVLKKGIQSTSSRLPGLAAGNTKPVPARRSSTKINPWLVTLGILLLCNGAVCFTFALLLLLGTR